MRGAIKKQDIPGIVITFILGIGITSLGFVMLKNAAQSSKWPTTDGTVTSSVMSGGTKHSPIVNYTYLVDSVTYTSSRIGSMNFATKNESAVEEVLKRYPAGSEVKVYYKSTDPSKALLEPGVNNGNIILFGFGLFLLAIPVLSLTFMKLEIKKDTGRDVQI